MRFDTPLVKGTLIRRYKRFLADIRLDNGETLTAHTPNTGAMLGCAEPGSTVWLKNTANPKRKYPFSWELVQTPSGSLVGVNTLLSNYLAKEAVENGTVDSCQGYGRIRTEVKYGRQNSRIDLLLDDHPRHADCYLEVKNVTLAEHSIGYFPDAVSIRASKHLQELIYMVSEGFRAIIFFCVQRQDVEEVRPADHIDKNYGQLLRQAAQIGVELLAYRAQVSPCAVKLTDPLPVVIA